MPQRKTAVVKAQPAGRVAGLLRRPGPRVALAACLLVALLLPFAPLARVPGYESALAATLLAVLAAASLGIAAVRQERAIRRGEGPPGLEAAPTPWPAALAAGLPVLGVILAVLGSAFFSSLLVDRCSPVRGLAWYLLLPLPSAALALALGMLAAALVRRAGLLFGASLLLSFAFSALPVLFGPQVFLYDHLLGYLPGPLYDESVPIERPLLHFRFLTLCWAALAFAWLRLLWREGGARSTGSLVPLVALPLLLIGWTHGPGAPGFRQSTARVAQALGGKSEGARCTLLHPKEMEREALGLLLDECDLRVEQLEAFFGVEAPRPTVFLYRSMEEKRRLVGAAGTQFAKPWLAQLHIDARGHPHPVLKHELAHLIAAPLGRPPFGVSAAALGFLPIQGLIEGAAVAADWPADELTVHEKAAALERMGLAPRLDRILDAAGFWSQPASRAYSYAGSFVRWLVETRGPERFGRLYRDGDFQAAYGVGLERLSAEWRAFLQEVPLDEAALAWSEGRFRRSAIFRRPCAREVAELAREAGIALRAGDEERAIRLYRRCAELDEGDPAHLRGLALAWSRLGAAEELQALARRARDGGMSPLVQAEIWLHAGDALALQGRGAEALAAYAQVQEAPLDAGRARALAVRLEAAEDEALAKAALPYLSGGTEGALFAVRELLAERPEWGAGWYLVGRRLHQWKQHEAAARDLERALEAGLAPALEREARWLRALSLASLGRGCAALEALAAEGSAGQRLEAKDRLALCRYREAKGR